MTTENELLEMSEHFKQVVNRKDREIKLIKERCDEADDEIRQGKDRIIEMNIIINHLKFLLDINVPNFILKHMIEELNNKIASIGHNLTDCRETIDCSDLTEDFFAAFEDQI